MAKTLFLAEKDEATYLGRVNKCLEGGLPDSYRAFAVALREDGFSPEYAAYMVKVAQEQLDTKIKAMLGVKEKR
jgi:hypothetical protein